MTGHARDMFHINTTAVVINILGCLILIPSFSLVGAAVANATALGAQNIIALVMVMRRLHISTIPGIKSLAR